MDSARQQKFGRLIQKELAEIFRVEMPLAPTGALVTVSHVKVSPDLGVATVYLSFLGVARPDAVIAEVDERQKAVRNLLARRIRNQARIIPELRFFVDNTAEEADRIEKLIATLDIPKDDAASAD